jgi:hypothetical protein
LASVEAYDVNGGRWVGGLASMHTGRRQHGVTATALFSSFNTSSQLLAAGGVDATGSVLSSAELYDSEEDRWAPLPPMTQARAGLAVVSVPATTVVYAFGGQDPEGRVLSSIEVFNGTEWRVVGNMKKPRVGHGASLTGGGTTIHVYGGSDGDGQPQNTVEVFDAATGAWLRYGPKMKDPRSRVSSALVSDGGDVERLVAVGGVEGDRGACEMLTLLLG